MKLSVPAMTGMLVMASYNVIDTIFVGRGVGPLGLGAVAAAFPIQFIVHALAMLVGVGTASLVSRSLGAGDLDKAERALGNSLIMALLAGIAVSLLGRGLLPFLSDLTGAPEEIRPFLHDYLGTIFLGSPLLVSGITMNCVIRAEGNAKIAMLTMVLSALTNIVLDPLFIFVLKMGYGKYLRYIESEKWFILKNRIKKRDKNKCTKCNSNLNLHVHHITYDNLFNEKDKDLITLCSECHKDFHKDDYKKFL